MDIDNINNMMYDSDDDDDEPPALVDFTPSTAPTLIDDDPPPPPPPPPLDDNAINNINPLPPAEEETNILNPAVASSQQQQQQQQQPPCPVTILSGFLGSGKTTLIQYILRDPNHGKRIAVIENEFGEGLAVESLIARDGDNNNSLQDLIELPNGCICCTVKDSLVATLENLISKKSDLDYIIIESSGMANPGPIASVFWLDDALESRLQLDGIVTLVDAKHILKQLETTEEAAQQIAYADRILINKMDLIEEEVDNMCMEEDDNDDATRKKKSSSSSSSNNYLETIKSTIRKLHPSAPFQCTKYSQIPDLDWILGANCFGGTDRIEELDLMWNQVQQQQQQETSQHHGDNTHTHDHTTHGSKDHCQYCRHKSPDNNDMLFMPPTASTSPSSSTGQQQQQQQHSHQHQHQHSHSHTAAVVTVAYENKGSIDLSKLNKWLADILWPDQDETDKVLTAMLHHSQQQQQQSPSTTTSSSDQQQPTKMKKSPSTQIFRIKGIVSVKFPTLEDAMMMMTSDNDDTTTPDNGGGSAAAEGVQQQQRQYYDPITKLDQRRYIVQAVHDLWEVHPGSDNLLWSNQEERVCKIVIIGKNLDSHKLRKGFLDCFV